MGYDNFLFLHVWDYIKNYYKLNKLISLLIYYLPTIWLKKKRIRSIFCFHFIKWPSVAPTFGRSA